MKPENILIIGSNGQLGKSLQHRYPEAKAVDQSQLDISDIASVNTFDWSNINSIINAAAFTNVDMAETAEGRSKAWKVNALGPANLSCIARQHSITLVHISTDYVFDGQQDLHTEQEDFSPLNVYGQSKAAGDIAVALLEKYYILRTSWVIGEGRNFVNTMMSLADRGINPTVVSDQIGRLTFTDTLTEAINYLLTKNAPYGTYNVSNDGSSASWADIARTAFQISNHTNITVSNTTTEAYFSSKPGVAPRPLHSTLDLHKIKGIGFQPQDWKDSLAAYLNKEVNT